MKSFFFCVIALICLLATPVVQAQTGFVTPTTGFVVSASDTQDYTVSYTPPIVYHYGIWSTSLNDTSMVYVQYSYDGTNYYNCDTVLLRALAPTSANEFYILGGIKLRYRIITQAGSSAGKIYIRQFSYREVPFNMPTLTAPF